MSWVSAFAVAMSASPLPVSPCLVVVLDGAVVLTLVIISDAAVVEGLGEIRL